MARIDRITLAKKHRKRENVLGITGSCRVRAEPGMSSARTGDAALPLPLVLVTKMKSVNDCLCIVKSSISNRWCAWKRARKVLGGWPVSNGDD